MDTEYKKILIDNGINVESALERFMGNEVLFERFLKKFLADSSFETLAKNIEIGECEEAFKAAHTLKGVAGNLSLEQIHKKTIPIVEALRNQDLDTAKKAFSELEQCYQKVIAVLSK